MEASGTGGMRNCVGCGRSISWDANVCPYCGRDYRVVMSAQPQQKISEGIKIVFYILSFLIWIVGLIIGLVYYTKDDPESKEVGKMCLILAAIGVIVSITCSTFLFWV